MPDRATAFALAIFVAVGHCSLAMLWTSVLQRCTVVRSLRVSMIYSGVLEKSSLTTESRNEGAERVSVRRGGAAESDGRSSFLSPGNIADDDDEHGASELAVDGR